MTTLIAQTIDLIKEAQDQKLQFADLYSPTSNAPFGKFASQILQGVMIVAVLAVFILIIWGAFEWITAGGEKSKVETASGKITGAIIGILVLSASVAIFSLLQTYLGIKVF